MTPLGDAALVEALQGSLGDASVAQLDRRPSAYRTSFPLEEVDALLSDGTVLRLVLKDLRRRALDGAARRAKPAFLYSPRREVAVYRSVLSTAPLGTARLFAAADEGGREPPWLLLERVPGVELYQVGDLGVWREVARWLARLHARFLRPETLPAEAPLIRHDAAYYRRWMRRALAFRRRRGGSTDGLERVAERYDEVVERILALPRSLIHGELYASNVLVQERAGRARRVCPVDWETAALGPGLVDLAALVAGAWSEAERESIARAYLDEWTDLAPAPLPEETFRDGLACCRLHLAVQWLGWSARWSPPREHAHDWLREALDLSERIPSPPARSVP